MLVRVMGGRNDAQDRGQHFYCGEDTDLPSAYADIIHRKNYHPRIRNSLAKTDEDIAQEQTPHRLIQLAQASPKVPALSTPRKPREALCCAIGSPLPLHQNCQPGEKN